jgi:hypothetical protein
MSFKRYKSVFSESKKVNKKLSLRKESILNRFKRVLREEDLNPSDVEDIVGKIEEVITDVIGNHGVDNPVIDELSSTVKAINMQNRMTSDIDMMESRLNNKFRKLKKESMYDMDMDDMGMEDEMDDMYDEPVESFDTGYDMSVEDDEFMYDADSIMEAEEDEDEEDEKKESYKKAKRMIREADDEEDEDEEDDEKEESYKRIKRKIREAEKEADKDEEMEEAYDDEEEDEKEKKEESYKRKKRIAEMKRKLLEAEEEEDEEDEKMYDEEEDEMKEEAE